MSITKSDLSIQKRNNFFDIIYKKEIIFKSSRKEIDEQKIINVIKEIEDKYLDLNSKIKKFLIILGLSQKIHNDKQIYLLDRLIIEDKECLESMKQVDEDIVNEFLALAVFNEINYQQYNPKRLLKKLGFFLFLSIILYFLNLNIFIILALFLFFFLTEPKPFSKILVICGKLKQNS
jgi:hypothetical protein